MHEDGNLQGLRPLPEGPQGRVAQLHLVHPRGDDDAFEFEVENRALQLLDGEVRILQGHGGDADQPVRRLGDHFGHVVIVETLQPQALGGVHRIGTLMQDVGAHHLDIHAHGVHIRQAQIEVDHPLQQFLGQRPHGAASLRADLAEHGKVIGGVEDLLRHGMGMEIDDDGFLAHGMSQPLECEWIWIQAAPRRRSTMARGSAGAPSPRQATWPSGRTSTKSRS